MIRRGTNYGQQLPRSVLGDDDADRGLLFAFVGAHLDRQFEFVQREWINYGKFIGTPAEKYPLVSSSDSLEFTVPPFHNIHGPCSQDTAYNDSVELIIACRPIFILLEQIRLILI
jgi:deferrochelatase/peroxidase EfeB